MKICQSTVVAIFLFAAAFPQDGVTDAKMLEGTWTPKTAQLGETVLRDDDLKEIKLVIAGDQYTVTGVKAIDKGSIKFDAAKNPKTMDIIGGEGPNKGKTFLAIYEINGDTLRICYDLGGKTRPTEFATKKGAALFLVTYQRAKT